MDGKVLDYLVRKYDHNSDGDMRDGRRRDMNDRSRTDSRRGVRKYRRRRDYDDRNDNRDYDERDYDERDYDYDDRDYDERDYDDRDRDERSRGGYGRDGHHKKLRLERNDQKEWKRMMENADGTMGAHYDMQATMKAAEKARVRFDSFDEKEFCLALNLMYSLFCNVAKARHLSPEDEMEYCAEMAKEWLEADSVEPSEKLALYYHCFVKSE